MHPPMWKCVSSYLIHLANTGFNFSMFVCYANWNLLLTKKEKVWLHRKPLVSALQLIFFSILHPSFFFFLGLQANLKKFSLLLDNGRDRGIRVSFLALVFASKCDYSCFLVASMLSQECFLVCFVFLLCYEFCFCFNQRWELYNVTWGPPVGFFLLLYVL